MLIMALPENAIVGHFSEIIYVENEFRKSHVRMNAPREGVTTRFAYVCFLY